MSHTCGRRQVQGLAEELRRAMQRAEESGKSGLAVLMAAVTRAAGALEHISCCMEAGPDDPKTQAECPACGDTGPHEMQAPDFRHARCATCGETFSP